MPSETEDVCGRGGALVQDRATNHRADQPAGDRDQHRIIARLDPVIAPRRRVEAVIAAVIVHYPIARCIAIVEALSARPGAVWGCVDRAIGRVGGAIRSEEHTSELQYLMRISYAVFCLKKKT